MWNSQSKQQQWCWASLVVSLKACQTNVILDAFYSADQARSSQKNLDWLLSSNQNKASNPKSSGLSGRLVAGSHYTNKREWPLFFVANSRNWRQLPSLACWEKMGWESVTLHWGARHPYLHHLHTVSHWLLFSSSKYSAILLRCHSPWYLDLFLQKTKIPQVQKKGRAQVSRNWEYWKNFTGDVM